MPTETFLNLKPEKKTKIVEAALTELSIHPYDHINLANIIRDAGIARGSFYQYFIDKDDLYMFIIMHVSQVKGELFKDVFDLSNELSFLERFKKMYLRGFVFAQKYPKLVQVGQLMTQSSLLKTSELYKKSHEDGIQFFVTLIKKDQEKGIIRKSIDPYFLADALLGYMNTINYDVNSYSDSDMKQLEKNVDNIIDIIQKGIETHV